MLKKSLDLKVQIELLRVAYKQIKYIVIGQTLAMLVYIVTLWGVANRKHLMYWIVGTFFFCVVGRWIVLQLYNRSTLTAENIKIWRFLFALGGFLVGLSWGIAASVLMPTDPEYQVFVFFMIAGVTAITLSYYATVFFAYIFYLIPIMSLLMGWLLLKGEPYNFYAIMCLPYAWLMIQASKIYHDSLQKSYYLMFENIKLQKKQHGLAMHDELTKLPNRRLFRIRLAQAIKRARRFEKLVAVLYLDMDNFKFINDSLGHMVGDELLKVGSQRLKQILRETDTIARIGGDEFILILEDLKNKEAIEKIASEILAAFSKKIVIESHEINVTMSIGISCYPMDGKMFYTLLKEADLAMYQAKRLGKNRYKFYDIHENE